jgi:hypothetical protein
MNEDSFLCPHCNALLVRWEPSPYTGWGHDLYYCDNNECSYFLEGRRRICEEFEKNFAYRFCYDPENGQELPIITWCGGDLSLLKGRCPESPGPRQAELRKAT